MYILNSANFTKEPISSSTTKNPLLQYSNTPLLQLWSKAELISNICTFSLDKCSIIEHY